MSISGIGSYVNQNIASMQSQQQQIQQQFLSLAQQYQSDALSTEQTAAQNPLAAGTTAGNPLQPQNLVALGAAATPGSPSVPLNGDPLTEEPGASGEGPVQAHFHSFIHAEPGSGSNFSHTQATGFGQTGQSGDASTAQQAYSSVQQDLQQIALNSDLLNAQAATLQVSGLSLTA
jgi:hypothetical protein